MSDKESMELRDYLRVLRRRKRPLLIGLIATMAITALAVVLIPRSYRSVATIQVERQVVPDQWVSGPSLGFINERLHALNQRIQTRENLYRLAEKYALFEPGWEKTGAWLQEMRNDIDVRRVDIEVTDHLRARSMLVTVAFQISFDGPTPEIAQQVTQELATLYLQDNEFRRSQAAAVAEFLSDEAKRLGGQVDAIEQKLSEFKSHNLTNLPELNAVNRSLYDRALSDIDQTREIIRSLEQRRSELATRLAGTPRDGEVFDADGRRVSTAGDRLRLLRAEYASALALYSPDHPDVLRLEGEIAALEAVGTAAGSAGAVTQRVAELERQLMQLRQTRSSEHPDVRRLERQLQALRSQAPESGFAGGPGATNPAYLTLQVELSSVEADLRAQRTKLSQLQRSADAYEQRLMTSPAVEKEYQNLVRERDSVNAKYRQVHDRLLDAQMTTQLEGDQVGDRLYLVEPASLPTRPLNPHPLALMMFGSVLGLGSGVGAAAFSEYWDRSVRGRDGVRSVLNEPPLVVMPYVENREEVVVQERRRFRWASLALVALAVVVVALLYHLRGEDIGVLGADVADALQARITAWWPAAEASLGGK